MRSQSTERGAGRIVLRWAKRARPQQYGARLRPTTGENNIMTAPAKTAWRISGISLGACNCDWACPCQFNALPTHPNCEAFVTWEIRDGSYGATDLAGVRYALVFHWPGAVHEGNGTSLLIVDERASAEQRAAIEALVSGQQGGAYFEIFGSVTPNKLPALFLPIEIESDRTGRKGRVSIPSIGELIAEPIKNPITGEEHTVRIVLPNGFEFKEADVANAVSWTANLGDQTLTHATTYTQMYDFEWSNA
jgi:hypothetical protein